MCGFGTIRTTCSGMGYVVPLYADEPKVAESILKKKLIVSLSNVKRMLLFTASTSVLTKELMQKLNCPLLGESLHMYSKKKVDFAINKVFAHFNPNFSPI